MNRLFEREAGCVSKDHRGSFIVGQGKQGLYMSFGWNYRDSVMLLKGELKEVWAFLIEHGYEDYHNEDMEVYVRPTDNREYLKYRKELPGPVLNKEEAMRLMSEL